MSSERIIELIHGEIDGVNTPEQSAELERAVRDEGSMAELRDDMKRLAGVLDRVDEVEPPEGLSQAIRERIVPRDVSPAPLPFRKRVFPAAPGLRVAAALAAGLIVGLLAGPWVFRGGAGLETGDLVGTMAPSAHAGQARLEHEWVRATVRATREDGRVLVKLDVDARAEVGVELEYDPAAAGFSSFTRENGDFDVEARAGRFLIRGTGDLGGTLALDTSDEGREALRVVFRKGEEVLGVESIRPDVFE